MISGLTGQGFAVSSSALKGGGDIGDANVWRSSSAGSAGVAAARVDAGENLTVGDVIVTGWPMTPEWFAVVPDQTGALYVAPVTLPNGDLLQPSGAFGFSAELPDAGDWTDTSSGTGAWSVSSGVVTGTAINTGSNRADATAGDRSAGTVLMVIEGLSAVASANAEVEIIAAVATSNRFISMRNTSGVWYMDASGGVTTQGITVAVDVEILADGPANVIYWRFGRAGAWSSKAFASPFELPFAARLRVTRTGGAAASMSMSSALLLEL